MINNRKLKNKCAIITGASSGIGRETALSLAKEGCNIFMIARRQERLKELKDEIAALGVRAEYAVGDVVDEALVKIMVAEAYSALGGFDILVLSAGEALMRPFNLTTRADFNRLMEVNTFGVVNLCKESIGKMDSGGSIIFITSPAGIHGAKGMSAYALSKGGLVAFGKSLALELAPQKIRVNIVSPGFVKTEMTQDLYGKLSVAQLEKITSAHPLGAGSVVDVANTIKFLVSDEASWITGIVLAVDGGFTCGI